jgi:hypothetical protein
VTGGASGTSAGRVELSIGINNGAARAGTVTIAGRILTVNQAPAQASCVFTVAPLTLAAPDAGATAAVDVGSGEGCLWTAASQAPWISVTAGANGAGNGRVEMTVAPNTGAARTGTVAIAGQTFTVNQAAAPAPCSFVLTPTTVDAPIAGGPAAVDVATLSTCAWTAVSQAQWITVAAGASGTGNGRVELAIAVNAGPARVGTVTIGNQTFTVNQQGVPPAHDARPSSSSPRQ